MAMLLTKGTRKHVASSLCHPGFHFLSTLKNQQGSCELQLQLEGNGLSAFSLQRH